MRESRAELEAKAAAVRARVASFVEEDGIEPSAYLDVLASHILPLAGSIARRRAEQRGPLIAGVAGAQGTGKTTLAGVLQVVLEGGYQLRCARLSIDDLYLGRAERAELARMVHPLLRTRGVPGTHDLELGQRVFAALANPEASRVALPRFDKSADDRAPEANWPVVQTPIDCLIFDGWCVGARAVPERELVAPLNALERDEDPDARWRQYANAMLAGAYRSLFDPIDLMVFIEPPDLESSRLWRLEQEHKLRARASSGRATMSDAEIDRFVQHYERISRQMLADLPASADTVIALDRSHRFREWTVRSTSA